MSDLTDPDNLAKAAGGGGVLGVLALYVRSLLSAGAERRELVAKIDELAKAVTKIDSDLVRLTERVGARDARLDRLEALLERQDVRLRELEDFRSRESGIRGREG